LTTDVLVNARRPLYPQKADIAQNSTMPRPRQGAKPITSTSVPAPRMS